MFACGLLYVGGSVAKVLVTGGAGFVGSALVRALRKRGDEVHVLVRKKTDLSNLEGLPVVIHFGDVYYPQSLQEAMRGVAIVYHTAAVYQFFPWWQKKVPAIYKINVNGTRNVIHTAKREGVRRFVFTSSYITVGKQKDGKPSNEATQLSKNGISSHYHSVQNMNQNRLSWRKPAKDFLLWW